MKRVITLLLIVLAFGQISAQCISLLNCPGNTQNLCDYTNNHDGLWRESYWFDPINNLHDLSETSVDLGLTALKTCPNAVLNLRYLLYLDLDANGTWETVVKSWEPPAPGTVNFDNWNNPDFEGGEVRTFDERPVPIDQKYQFAIQLTSAGDSLSASLRWNNTLNPGTFVIPELPYGTHKIKWIAEDDLGNNQVCEVPFAIKDCKKPTVVCINGISVNIMPTQEITLWASDFLQYGEDNATPGSGLEYGIRKCGTGTGFPIEPDGSPLTSVTFNCSELGTQCVELWIRDASDNADYCETYAVIQDGLGNCSGGGGNEAPTVVCINGLSANILPNGMLTLWASDLLQYVEDDQTPINDLVFSLRRLGSGTGFPVDANGQPIPSLTFDCDELGLQLMELWVKDLDGATSHCETYAIILDNLNHCSNSGSNAPTIVCINGLSVNIMPTGMITVWASDFLQYVEDDNTPASEIQISMRLSGTGTGFPLDANNLPVQSLSFDCDQLGVQSIELWAMDQDGNADYCATYMIVEDNLQNCSNSGSAPPTVACLNGLSANLLPTGTLTLWATDFLVYMDDDNTPYNDIQLSLRLAGTGTGFPLDSMGNAIPSLIFDCEHLDSQYVELWAKDLDGNTAYCQTLALILDNLDFCPGQVILGIDPKDLAAQTSIIAPQPNPTSAGARIQLQLPQSGLVRVELADLSGKILWQNEVELASGQQLLDIPAESMSQTGVYVWRVMTGNKTGTGRLIRI